MRHARGIAAVEASPALHAFRILCWPAPPLILAYFRALRRTGVGHLASIGFGQPRFMIVVPRRATTSGTGRTGSTALLLPAPVDDPHRDLRGEGLSWDARGRGMQPSQRFAFRAGQPDGLPCSATPLPCSPSRTYFVTARIVTRTANGRWRPVRESSQTPLSTCTGLLEPGRQDGPTSTRLVGDGQLDISLFEREDCEPDMHGFEIRGGGVLRSTTLPGRPTKAEGGPPPGQPRGHDGRPTGTSRPSGGLNAPLPPPG